MHRKEDYTERGGIARFYHGDQVFERAQFDAGKAETLHGEGKNCAPKLLSRVAQCQEHYRAGLKRISGVEGRGRA